MTVLEQTFNGERKQFLYRLLVTGNPERDSILEAEIDNAPADVMLRAYEAAIYGNASNLKVMYILGGNDPEDCPFQ